MLKKGFLALIFLTIILPAISWAQSSTATYWRDPATGMVYEYRFHFNQDQKQNDHGRQAEESVNREISRGGQPVQQWDYLESERKILELKRLRRDLERDRR
jgi:hypothetical protein